MWACTHSAAVTPSNLRQLRVFCSTNVHSPNLMRSTRLNGEKRSKSIGVAKSQMRPP